MEGIGFTEGTPGWRVDGVADVFSAVSVNAGDGAGGVVGAADGTVDIEEEGSGGKVGVAKVGAVADAAAMDGIGRKVGGVVDKAGPAKGVEMSSASTSIGS